MVSASPACPPRQRGATLTGLVPESTLVYVCGYPGMIEDVAARLTPRDFTVKKEKYWHE